MYIIGDVHGCSKTLKALIDQLPDHKEHGICFAGDLCDRGPDTKGVYDYVIENKWDCVLGNHDLMFMMGVLQPESEMSHIWDFNGGDKARESYNIIRDGEVIGYDKGAMEKHAQWIANLPMFLEYPELMNEDGRHLVVSHNTVYKQWKFRDRIGQDDGIDKHFQAQVLWGNQYKHYDNPCIYNVTGHWASRKKRWDPVTGRHKYLQFVGERVKSFYACIDSGCGFKGGWLTALKFPEMIIYKQPLMDEIP